MNLTEIFLLYLFVNFWLTFFFGDSLVESYKRFGMLLTLFFSGFLCFYIYLSGIPAKKELIKYGIYVFDDKVKFKRWVKRYNMNTRDGRKEIKNELDKIEYSIFV